MSAQKTAKVTKTADVTKAAKATKTAKPPAKPRAQAKASTPKRAQAEAPTPKRAPAKASTPKRAPRQAPRMGEEGPVDLKAFARNKDTQKLKQRAEAPETWQLRLYVAGKTPKSIEAFRNLQQICEEHLKGRYQIEVIDLLTNPTLARGDQILALPTVVRQLPPPVKKIIGNFTNSERVLVGLDIRPLSTASATRTSSPRGEAT